MITMDMYKSYLSSYGNNLSEIKRTTSEIIIDNTFNIDPTYRSVYILSKNGWKFEDAKFQLHTTPSILKDAVDYYLQFRPKVFYPIGTYVFIPDNSGFQVNLSKIELINPFSLPDEKLNQLWMIVGIDDSGNSVRYNVLKCNWNFKWIYKNEINTCWGCVRDARSYTSGKWTDEFTSSLDNLTSAWLPDIYYTYGENLKALGLCDNRTITYEQRFMLTNNTLDPKVYQVTKIVDLVPKGMIKLTIKQDELNKTRDNIELKICDYYSNSGESEIYKENSPQLYDEILKEIRWMKQNENNELDYINEFEDKHLHIGKTSYFEYYIKTRKFNALWNIELIDVNNEYTNEEKEYYKNLLSVINIDSNKISIKPGKAKSLVGKRFLLTATDDNGDYFSSIEIEVIE